MAGPSFSGALLGNATLLSRLPMDVPSFGVLARWHAALFEMTTFFALDEKNAGQQSIPLEQENTCPDAEKHFFGALVGKFA